MFGVVAGRVSAFPGVGTGGELGIDEAIDEAIESGTAGFSTPIPTGLGVVVDPVEVTGGEYEGNDELEMKYSIARP